jgi:hypothetical protein
MDGVTPLKEQVDELVVIVLPKIHETFLKGSLRGTSIRFTDDLIQFLQYVNKVL